MRIRSIFLACLVALSESASGQSADLAVHQALAAAHRYERERRADQFAETTVNRNVIGQHFRLVVPFGDGQAYDGGPPGSGYYTYENARLRLIFSPNEYTSVAGGPRRLVMKFATRRTLGRGYVGTNAFGARARVSVLSAEEDGLAMLSRPTGMASPYADRYPRTNDPLDDYWMELEMPGPVARQLALRAKVIIEGTVQALGENTVAECHRNYGGPTIDNPTEVLIQTCWLGAAILRIAFVDITDGSVLREWRSAPAN